MHSVYVWDRFVRVFHWGTAALFVANFTVFEDESSAHIYAGYILFGLVVLRLLWGMIGTRNARFSAFWPTLSEIWFHIRNLATDVPEAPLSHNPLGAVMVFNLLATLVLICITGIMITSDAFWGIDWVENLHELLANYAIVCVGLHIAGVLYETRRSKVNLTKAMVTGYKDILETSVSDGGSHGENRFHATAIRGPSTSDSCSLGHAGHPDHLRNILPD